MAKNSFEGLWVGDFHVLPIPCSFFYLTKIWLSQVDAISNTSVSKDSQNLTESYQAFVLTYAEIQTYIYNIYIYVYIYFENM